MGGSASEAAVAKGRMVLASRASPWRAFCQDALQRAAVHVEPARRLGHVAVAQLINPLDMLPANAVSGHWVLGWWRFFIGRSQQRIGDLVRIGRLGQVVDGAKLNGGDGRGDVAVAGEDARTRIGSDLG